MKYNVTNLTSSVRKFCGGGRALTLAGSESERGVELSDAERDALIATKEFRVVEVKPSARSAEPVPPVSADAPAPKAAKHDTAKT